MAMSSSSRERRDTILTRRRVDSNTLDLTDWLLASATLVMFMTPGLAFFYSIEPPGS
jgi:hypothetical protein